MLVFPSIGFFSFFCLCVVLLFSAACLLPLSASSSSSSLLVFAHCFLADVFCIFLVHVFGVPVSIFRGSSGFCSCLVVLIIVIAVVIIISGLGAGFLFLRLSFLVLPVSSVLGAVFLLSYKHLGPSFLLLIFLVCPVHVAHILVLLLGCLVLMWSSLPHLSSLSPSGFALGLVGALFSVSFGFWCFAEVLQLSRVFLLCFHLLRPSSFLSLFPVCLVHGGLVFVFLWFLAGLGQVLVVFFLFLLWRLRQSWLWLFQVSFAFLLPYSLISWLFLASVLLLVLPRWSVFPVSCPGSCDGVCCDAS